MKDTGEHGPGCRLESWRMLTCAKVKAVWRGLREKQTDDTQVLVAK